MIKKDHLRFPVSESHEDVAGMRVRVDPAMDKHLFGEAIDQDASGLTRSEMGMRSDHRINSAQPTFSSIRFNPKGSSETAAHLIVIDAGFGETGSVIDLDPMNILHDQELARRPFLKH